MSTINFEDLQQKTRCNWCLMDMIQSEPMSQANLVDVGKKYPALYCSRCLAMEERVKHPKSVINLQTLDSHNVEDLPDVQKQQKQTEQEEKEIVTEDKS